MRHHSHRGAAAAAIVLTSGLLGVASTSTASAGADSAPLIVNGRIAFSTGFIQPDPDPEGHSQVYTVNPDGTDVRQLTHVPEGSQAGDPDWSPNGRRIAYVSNVSGDFSVMVMYADGSGKHALVQTAGSDYFTPRWSPDGTQLAVVHCRYLIGYPLGCDIDVLNADGTGRRILVGSHVVNKDPEWSPDGTQIAFDSNRAGLISAVWLVNSAGGGLQRLTRPVIEAFYPQWSPLGNRILFANNQGRPHTNTFVMNPDGSRARQLTGVPYPYSAFFATYAPDGRHISFISDHPLHGRGFELFTMNGNGTDVTPIVTDHHRVTYSDWGTFTSSTDAAQR